MGQVYIGTSGFSYPEWKGPFYPKGAKSDELLSIYATKLPAVEIDRTFYRTPSGEVLEGWRRQTPDGFKFTLKANQGITHFQRLKLPSWQQQHLMNVLPKLGDRLGCHFYQVSPTHKRDDARMAEFLAALPPEIPTAFEFRNDSWFAPAIYKMLGEAGAGLVITDGDEGCTPIEITGRVVYVRLRRTTYTLAERDTWIEALQGWARAGCDVFAFIKHDENPDAPIIALDWLAALHR